MSVFFQHFCLKKETSPTLMTPDTLTFFIETYYCKVVPVLKSIYKNKNALGDKLKGYFRVSIKYSSQISFSNLNLYTSDIH